MPSDNAPFLLKAREALKVARLALLDGCPNSAASRSYYAAFHAARAAIVRVGVSGVYCAWTHAALQSRFAQLVRSKKALPSRIKSYLAMLLAAREVADYSPNMVSSRMASDAVNKATEFVTTVELAVFGDE